MLRNATPCLASNLVSLEGRPLSRLNRVKSQLPRRVQQLAVAGEKGAAPGPDQAPGQGYAMVLATNGFRWMIDTEVNLGDTSSESRPSLDL